MTAKRFTKYVPDSYNYTSVITIVDHETNKRSGSIDDFVDMMNALHEENEQLRTKNNAYIQDIEVFKEENTHLKLENEQLKQFKQNVFDLINEKITFVNECEKNHNDIGIPHEYYRGADEILNLLKKELEE